MRTQPPSQRTGLVEPSTPSTTAGGIGPLHTTPAATPLGHDVEHELQRLTAGTLASHVAPTPLSSPLPTGSPAQPPPPPQPAVGASPAPSTRARMAQFLSAAGLQPQPPPQQRPAGATGGRADAGAESGGGGGGVPGLREEWGSEASEGQALQALREELRRPTHALSPALTGGLPGGPPGQLAALPQSVTGGSASSFVTAPSGPSGAPPAAGPPHD